MKKNDPNLKTKAQEKNIQRKNKIRIYYSFLTVVLLVFLAQTGIGAFLNITKSINYHVKINKMQKLNEQSQAENAKLKSEIKDFSNLKSLEAIARNNLKMAEKDEVLVIISDKNKTAPSNKNSSVLKLKKD